ncbi:rhomboid family intramembrane serine protease [Desulfotruncus alcoholivorax]|uniref:rhomboid family intramembrane serine protease n=1 Tax=Desulfotruncus alcoholivorax TaxID=265477 RepID=UPI000412FF40|nr:rhomboid family intramembrane serine protease [Desulfotruncus alcoholivorax]
MIPLRDSIRSSTFPIVNLSIIILNLVIYVWEVMLGPQQLNQIFYIFGLVPARALDIFLSGASITPVLVNLFTSIFIHGGWVHVIGNMLFLWVFGDNIEDRLGHFKYLLFYLAAGVAGGVAHILSNPASTIPVVGASGAIAGVLGAYVVAFPRSRILALVPIFIIFTLVEIPALIFIALWFVIQIFNGVASLGGSVNPVAWWAHVGGFITGALLIKTMAPRGVRGYYRS